MKNTVEIVKKIPSTFLVSCIFFGVYYLLFSYLKATAITLLSIVLVSYYAWVYGTSRGILLSFFNIGWIALTIKLTTSDYTLVKTTDAAIGSCIHIVASVLLGYFGKLSRKLQNEVEERKKAQTLLTTYQNELERLVEERTHELEIANEKLNQAEKMEAIGKLAGSIAHDFKNYLTIILGYTNILLKKLDDTSQEHTFVQQIHKSGENAAELTTELLTFAHKEQFVPKPIHLNTLLDNINVLFSKSIAANISLIINPQKNLPMVMGGESKIQNALLNLVINARDAIGEKNGTITISTSTCTITSDSCTNNGITCTPGEFVALKVSDTADGIPQDILPHIFEPFNTTKPKGKGTGMGLATVYGIAKSHKGGIIVDSSPETGTTFTILFPVASEEELEAADSTGNMDNQSI
jgi:signal transduction histidine kinase